MKNVGWMLIAAFLVAGCGKDPGHETRSVDVGDGYRFVTRELTPAEMKAMGIADDEAGDPAEPQVPARDVRLSKGDGVGSLIVNTIAGVAQKLITPGDTNFAATLVGQALPPKATAFDLAGAKTRSRAYEKILKSTPLGTTLVKIVYKVSYQYGGSHKGKGAYLANVKFVPVKVDTDAIWSAQASSLSEQPTNAGTATNPVAKLGFSLTFVAKGIGTRTVTDEFEIEAATGEAKESIRKFE